MPFKSAAQRAFLFIHHPEMAKKWVREFPDQGKLPKYVKNSTLKIYKGAPHGLTETHKEKINADLLSFAKA